VAAFLGGESGTLAGFEAPTTATAEHLLHSPESIGGTKKPNIVPCNHNRYILKRLLKLHSNCFFFWRVVLWQKGRDGRGGRGPGAREAKKYTITDD